MRKLNYTPTKDILEHRVWFHIYPMASAPEFWALYDATIPNAIRVAILLFINWSNQCFYEVLPRFFRGSSAMNAEDAFYSSAVKTNGGLRYRIDLWRAHGRWLQRHVWFPCPNPAYPSINYFRVDDWIPAAIFSRDLPTYGFPHYKKVDWFAAEFDPVFDPLVLQVIERVPLTEKVTPEYIQKLYNDLMDEWACPIKVRDELLSIVERQVSADTKTTFSLSKLGDMGGVA